MSGASSPALSAGPALTCKLTRCYPAANPDDPQPKPASTIVQALDLQKATDSNDETDHHLSVSTDDNSDTSEPTSKRKRGYLKDSKKKVSQ